MRIQARMRPSLPMGCNRVSEPWGEVRLSLSLKNSLANKYSLQLIHTDKRKSSSFYSHPDRWSTVVPRVVELSKGPRPRDLMIEMEPLTPRFWRLQMTSALAVRRQQRAINISEITQQGTIWPTSVLICTDHMCLLFRRSKYYNDDSQRT